MSKRNRELLLVLAAIIMGIAVWWVYFYAPRQEQISEIQSETELTEMKIRSHRKQLKKLKREIEDLKEAARVEAEKAGGVGKEEALKRLLVTGRTIEEVNAASQGAFQEFISEHGVDFKSYKELSPSKWGDYKVGRLQFQLSTDTQGLSDLLAYFDNLEKAIRIDRLTINYRRGKKAALIVNLHLGTLFVGDLEK